MKLRIKIIKSRPQSWYRTNINQEFEVMEYSDNLYILIDDIDKDVRRLILKENCEII